MASTAWARCRGHLRFLGTKAPHTHSAFAEQRRCFRSGSGLAVGQRFRRPTLQVGEALRIGSKGQTVTKMAISSVIL